MARTPPLLRRSLAAAALVLAVGCTTVPPTSPPSKPAAGSPTPVPTEGPTPTPVAEGHTPTPAAGESGPPGDLRMCDERDLELDHGDVDGAAGSRFTRVHLVVRGSSDCGLMAIPTFELRDAGGARLIVSISGISVVVPLAPGDARQSDVQLAEWCLPPAPEPFALLLLVDDETSVPVSGGPFPDPGGLPPCFGGAERFIATVWGMP